MAKETYARVKLVAVRSCALWKTYAMGYQFLHCPN